MYNINHIGGVFVKRKITLGLLLLTAILTIMGGCNKDITHYSVDYSLGYKGADSIAQSLVAVGGSIEEPVISDREGYIFAGWYDNADFSGQAIVFPYTPTSNTKLYAKYELVVMTSVSVDVSNAKTSYYVGENFTYSGLVVTAHFSNGSSSIVAEGDYFVDSSTYIKSKVGSYSIIITSKESKLQASYSITVEENSIVSYVANVDNAKKVFGYGESFSSNNISVTKTLKRGDIIKLNTNEYTVDSSQFNSQVLGTYDITISVPDTDFTYKYSVTVVDRPKELILKTDNVKMSYNYGEDLDLSGLVVQAISYNGEFTTLSDQEYLITHSFDKNRVGTYAITVKLSGTLIEKSFNVTVSDYILNISLNTEYTATQFDYGDSFRSNLLVVYKNMASGSRQIALPSEYQVNSQDYNANQVGKYNITVTLNDTQFSASYEVTVVDYILTYEISGQKTQFNYGEEIDISGIVVTRVMASGTRLVLTQDQYTIDTSNYNSHYIGEQTITISIDGSEVARYTITIVNVMVGLTIDSSGAKTQYSLNEELDLSGLIIKKVMKDGTHIELTDEEYTTIGVVENSYDNTKIGTQTVVITFGDSQATYTVEVLDQ